ncbi:MAG: hypothetical protein CVV61_03095 [Tenericutes bacterium HGW-Tenericutes-6]|jgi:sugar lactone lactonase YvrE|nr:MAG: hypothetical protein CVV61_03095 [Tenericutes bacterium HGW-Tenericutes-6]
MKKLLILSMMLLSIMFFQVFRLEAITEGFHYGIPYQTYTLNAQNEKIPTQTAYIPVGVFGSSIGLNKPEDIYFHEGLFYIADAGNQRIVVTNPQGDLIHAYISNEFMEPTGVFVKDQFLYIADKQARKVFKMHLQTEVITQIIEKPTSPIYGQNNEFVPTKVAVDNSDSIYIIGEGSTSGVIQVNYAGEFVGYLGINTVPLSLRRILYNFFVGDDELASNLPASPTNVALGTKGSLLTTNVNVYETFKRLNISGVNTLSGNTVYPSSAPSDIHMSSDDYIFMVSDNGEVHEYDANGNLLFYFNTKDAMLTRTLGLTSIPKGITTDQYGNLYIADAGYHQIHIYQKTVFVDLVHEAVTLYNDGRYIESKALWEEILRQNSSFALAQSALGRAFVKEERFNDALDAFYDARDYQGYSDAYWEIRNVAIQNHFGTFALIFILSYVTLKIGLSIYRKSPLYVTYSKKKDAFLEKKLPKELYYAKHILKQPYELFYGIKREERGSYQSGSIVLGLFIMVFLINRYATGFLFRNPNTNTIFIEVAVIIGLFMLYVTTNYLVSTLNDGEGRFKDVFITTSYVLLPYIIFTLPMTFLSNFLTYNELFIFEFYHQIIFIWSLILLFISIKGLHNYTFFEFIKNTLIIIFGMFMIILVGLLIYAFSGQLFEFVISIIREVIYRV